MPKVFISYRRDDSKWAVDILDLRLTEEFGRDNVFRDVISMAVGDWQAQIRARVHECDVLLVVIGSQWAKVANEYHIPRIHLKDDWVRFEIAEALRLGKTVVPILVETGMPHSEGLPDDLKTLPAQQSWPLRSAPDLAHDLENIVEKAGGRRKFFVAPAQGVLAARQCIELCDREHQRPQFTKALRELARDSRKRPWFFVLHGAESQGHESLLERFVQMAEAQRPYRTYPTWDFDPEQDLEDYVLDELFEELGERQRLDHSPQRLAAVIGSAAHRQPVISHEVRRWTNRSKEALQAYIRFWERVPLTNVQPMIFFLVYYPGNNESRRRVMLKGLKELRSATAEIRLIRELDMVEHDHVMAWFFQTGLHTESERLKYCHELFGTQKRLPMATVEAWLVKHLDNRRVA